MIINMSEFIPGIIDFSSNSFDFVAYKSIQSYYATERVYTM